MFEDLKQTIQSQFDFSPNKNQMRDIERLLFEIIRRDDIALNALIADLKSKTPLDKYYGRNKFFAIKEALIKRRFPLTAAHQKIDTKKVFSSKLRKPIADNWQIHKPFKPLKIFVEKEVRECELLDNFKRKFPAVDIEELNYYSDYLKTNKFSISQLKKPLVFIVKEKWDFIKPCPCTKNHVCCGYWILNLGFGCSFDCSYCFLQHYTNFPGLLLPGNIEDFFEQFDAFYRKLKKPIRIGTGEFCDSLALDNITGYSKKLIPYFEGKHVLFELKTKSTNIANLVDISPPSNIVISWSLNPSNIAEKEELGAASLEERLLAAKKVQDKGYRIAFHFDPIIHFEGWEKEYKELIDKLYSHLKPPFAWISLGTLRSNRELKNIVESRFTQSSIFYGELLLGEDKKLRYPEFIRRKIYESMVKYIKQHDQKTPIYLCMENKKMWGVLGENLDSTPQIEKYLLNL
ncbi:MAG: hypothetical protein JSW17_05755 [Candidatus Omnitrophota bacterium]|nr:MAG: hypothetical protein JSW17_05755 [Candidatus Omnitrophota bacterium]